MKRNDILSKRRLSRDFQNWRVVQLGWTQNKVGDAYGLERRTISEISKNISSKEIANIQAQYAKKFGVSDYHSAVNSSSHHPST